MKEKKENSVQKRKRRIFLGWVLFVLFVGVIFFVARWFLGGSSQGIVWTNEDLGKETVRPAISNKQFNGKYLIFTYSGDYTSRDVEKDAVSLEKALFRSGGNASRVIAVTVRNMTDKKLSDIPEYQLRNEIERKKYKKKEEEVRGRWEVSFLRTDEGYERTVFIEEGNLLYTISVNMYGFGKEDVIEQDYRLILDTVEFFPSGRG
jgi:hypothetical protein